jgi:hypothetical protein
MSYRDHALNIITHYLFEPWDEQTRNDIEAAFRGQCPGPYRLVWRLDLDDDSMPQCDLVFEDPKEATAWYLKWS